MCFIVWSSGRRDEDEDGEVEIWTEVGEIRGRRRAIGNDGAAQASRAGGSVGGRSE